MHEKTDGPGPWAPAPQRALRNRASYRILAATSAVLAVAAWTLPWPWPGS